MKKVFYLALTIVSIMLFTKCLDTGSYIRYEVGLNITSYYFPDTSIVNRPCSVNLFTKSENSCINNPRFLISKGDETLYRFLALGTFENRGESCFLFTRDADSTYTFTPTQVGKYYFQFYSVDTLIYDTLVVVSSRK